MNPTSEISSTGGMGIQFRQKTENFHPKIESFIQFSQILTQLCDKTENFHPKIESFIQFSQILTQLCDNYQILLIYPSFQTDGSIPWAGGVFSRGLYLR